MSASIFLFILSQPFYGVGIGITIDSELNIAPVQEEHISFRINFDLVKAEAQGSTWKLIRKLTKLKKDDPALHSHQIKVYAA